MTPHSATAEVEPLAPASGSLPDFSSEADRRGGDRRPVLSSVLAEPLDDNFQPAGTAFVALTRNVSRGGIALLYTQPIGAKYLALRQPGVEGGVRYVEVVRSKLIGYGYEIAGRFIEPA